MSSGQPNNWGWCSGKVWAGDTYFASAKYAGPLKHQRMCAHQEKACKAARIEGWYITWSPWEQSHLKVGQWKDGQRQETRKEPSEKRERSPGRACGDWGRHLTFSPLGQVHQLFPFPALQALSWRIPLLLTWYSCTCATFSFHCFSPLDRNSSVLASSYHIYPNSYPKPSLSKGLYSFSTLTLFSVAAFWDITIQFT